MSLYDVIAVAVDPEYPDTFSPSRVERIDTETNELFAGCDSAWQVEDKYHEFWNRLNASWENSWPDYKEKVLVISVKEVT